MRRAILLVPSVDARDNSETSLYSSTLQRRRNVHERPRSRQQAAQLDSTLETADSHCASSSLHGALMSSGAQTLQPDVWNIDTHARGCVTKS